MPEDAEEHHRPFLFEGVQGGCSESVNAIAMWGVLP